MPAATAEPARHMTIRPTAVHIDFDFIVFLS
ncbi:hypothetical protein AZ54_19580 [Xanthomonas oryzae pv. oryzae PXO86]|nr:hypothetical protein AZ54_19580 [Xanthomonas oryzae pv. oryzae PXO86]